MASRGDQALVFFGPPSGWSAVSAQSGTR
jgi:hypothetical protein